MIVSKLQNLFFGDNQTNIVPTGINLITNGSFNSTLTGWTPVNFSWQTGTAAYVYSSGGYGGSVTQSVNLIANKKYKLTFKYKAVTPFSIHVSVVDNSNPSILIGSETTIIGVYNGLWQQVELYVISPTDITADLILECLSITGVANPSIPNPAESPGTETEGFFFDDVKIFETKKINRNCEACDVVVMDSNKHVEFQVKLESETEAIFTEDFTENPYIPFVLETGGIAFDITTIPTENTEFIFYMCGKTFRFNFTFDVVPLPGYSVVITGDVYEFLIALQSGMIDEINGLILLAMQDYIDDLCGSTSAYQDYPLLHFIITDVPIGSYYQDNSGILSNIINTGTSENTGSNFLYDNSDNPSLPTSRICYDSFAYGSTFYEFDKVLTANNRYKFCLNYSSVYDDFVVFLDVDDGVNSIQTMVFPIVVTSDSDTCVYFDALLTGSHNLKIKLVDVGVHGSGLCINGITITEENADLTIILRDCHGNETDISSNPSLPSTTSLYQNYNENILVQLPLISEGIYTVIVIDGTGNEYESVGIQMIDFNGLNECKRNQYLKLNWFDTCTLDNVDYTNLPFMNEVYLLGSIKEVNNIQKERVNYTSPTGGIEPVFVHSLISQTITIANFSNTLHRLIAKIFEHKYFYVNDERGKIDNGKYDIIKLKDGNSTGEIEYVIDGSELVNRSCCC